VKAGSTDENFTASPKQLLPDKSALGLLENLKKVEAN